MNTIQQTFDCCGVDKIDDWKEPAINNKGQNVSDVDGTCCKKSGVDGYQSSCKTRPYNDAVVANVKKEYYETVTLRFILNLF